MSMRGAYSSLRSTDQFLEFNVPSSSYKVDHSMNTDNESCPLCEKDNALITIDDDICCKHCGFVAGRSNQKTDYGGSMDGVPREPDHITETKLDAAATKSREDERKKKEGKRHDSFGSSTSFRNSDKVIYNKDHLGKYVTRSINWKKFAEMDEDYKAQIQKYEAKLIEMEEDTDLYDMSIVFFRSIFPCLSRVTKKKSAEVYLPKKHYEKISEYPMLR